MISCLLLHTRRNSRGLQTSSRIRISGDALEIGRGTACHIHLPDHRVGLLHATLFQSEDGAVQIGAEHGALISVDGFIERCATLHPGSRIGIGPYLLTVGAVTDDVDLVLNVELTPVQEEGAGAARTGPLTLEALNISKRKLGGALAAFILLAFVLLPALPRALPAFDEWQARLPLTLSEPLSPGSLSAGHGGFGKKCSTCHQRAFQAVADAACTECHGRVSTHLAANSPLANKLQGVRCADCHAAHEGKAEAMKDGSSRCLGCHKNVDTAVADARDFGTKHPPFHLTVPMGGKLMRIRQDEANMLAEKPGLKFSHRLHLAKKGVSSPNGDTVLTCRNCHLAEKSGNQFVPMEMKMTCQQSRCHRMRFDEPAGGLVPHGSEAELMNILRISYSGWLAEAPAENARGCPPNAKAANNIKRILDCADRFAREKAAATLFRTSGEKLQCGLCHEIVESKEMSTPWRVAPVKTSRDWQPKAVFVHARHATVDCTECHDKANSKVSADIFFPDIGKCRECHSGASAGAGKVKSGCDSCHRFHRNPATPS